MALRWEWRTFGDRLDDAEVRLGPRQAERVTESDETYLLSPESRDAVKARDGLMDVKRLVRVDADGLELWRPVMKSRLPVSAADAGAVLAALRAPAPVPALDREAYDVDDIAAAAAAIVAVPVHKTRRQFTFRGCRAELTDVRAGDRATRTIAVESEDPARVLAAVRELGLEARPNVNVPRGLRALL